MPQEYFDLSGRIEVPDGRLFWNDKERLAALAMLLENIGVDAAIRIGDPEVWRAAIKAL